MFTKQTNEKMKIKELKSGSFRLDFTIDGIRRRETYKNLVQVKERQFQIQSLKIIPTKPTQELQKEVLLMDCYNQYKKWNEINNRLKLNTIKLHDIFYRNIFGWLVSRNIVNVSQLNKNVFDDYVQFRKKQSVSLCTIKKEFYFLSGILNHSLRRDIINKNPIVGYFDKIKIVSKVPETPTVSELQKIFDCLPDIETKKAFYFIAAHGCRYGEFATLQAKDINNGMVRLHREQKGGYERSLPLEKLPFEYNQKDLAFTFHDRKWRKENLCNRIKKACSSAGVPEIVTHTLRHCYATYQLVQGMNLYTLMSRGGWKSFAVVQRYVSIAERYKLRKDGGYLPKWNSIILLFMKIPRHILGTFCQKENQKNVATPMNKELSWLECLLDTQEVTGSTPVTPTILEALDVLNLQGFRRFSLPENIISQKHQNMSFLYYSTNEMADYNNRCNASVIDNTSVFSDNYGSF